MSYSSLLATPALKRVFLDCCSLVVVLPHRLRLLGASDHLSEDSLSTDERVHSLPPSTAGGDDLLYFLRRGPCSSPHIPLGGDSGIFALFCMPFAFLSPTVACP